MGARNYSLRCTLHRMRTVLGVSSATRKLSRNGLVVDDSSAQPLDRTGRGIVVSPSRLLAAVPRFLMVANTTGSARPQIPVGHPIRLVPKDTLYDVRMAASGRRTDNMPSPEKDRLAAEAMQCWADFQEGLSSDKRNIRATVSSFLGGHKALRRVDKVDPLIHRSVASELMNFSIASKGNVSASQATFFEMRSACSASFLADMTRISRGMNHRVCKEVRPCNWPATGFDTFETISLQLNDHTDLGVGGRQYGTSEDIETLQG